MSAQKNTFQLPKEVRPRLVSDIIAYFATERDETIGVIAAEEILDGLMPLIYPVIYQQAIQDCQKKLKEHQANLDFELENLKTDNSQK